MKTRYNKTLQKKKGVAGLNILLSVISMLFMIGIIVMVYILAGARLSATVGDATASASINATTTALDSVTDWFSTYIVMVSLVVIILLVVIIINSIRQSGITEGA